MIALHSTRCVGSLYASLTSRPRHNRVQSNDLSALPDFLSSDDDVEASLRPPGAAGRRQQQPAGSGTGGDNINGSAGYGKLQVPSLVPRPKATPLRSMG